jgi:transcription initiation factor TFIIH subunit 3
MTFFQKLPIDVLTLPPPGGGTAPPIFLQQAAHLTEGIYWRWNGRGGLLQYLHVSGARRRLFQANIAFHPSILFGNGRKRVAQRCLYMSSRYRTDLL